jgi:L-fucose isomerase-like protein
MEKKMNKKLTFALFFGNRGFFPGELVASAREEVRVAVNALGHDTLEMNSDLTRFGAVETIAEGKTYAQFLEDHRGKFDGVILSLPNFGDENGASVALRDCDVPILIQAYPDEIGLMDFSHRRDAFCGKISIADVFGQTGIKFTVWEPHTCHPSSPEFEQQLVKFAGVCNVVKHMRRMNVGSIGIRPTAFKTIRFDELALQKYNINVEAFDLLQLIDTMDQIDTGSEKYKQALKIVNDASDLSQVPQDKVNNMAKLYVALKQMAEDYDLQAIAIRCWSDMQKTLGITPCLINGILNSEGIPVACETDVCNAISMYALQLASEEESLIMDWNNNFANEREKCILFHCGNVAPNLMTSKGKVISHVMLDKGQEELGGIAWGCNQGRIKPGPLTYLSSKTEDGKVVFYLGEGQVTEDEIENAFFGCAGVAEIPDLQKVLLGVCKNGYRHHVSMTLAHVQDMLIEALTNYLGFEIDTF